MAGGFSGVWAAAVARARANMAASRSFSITAFFVLVLFKLCFSELSFPEIFLVFLI
jgi:hypothetical protein